MINADNKTPDPGLGTTIVNKLTAQAWMASEVAPGDSAAMTVSWFSPVGKADRWLITQSFQVTDPNMVLTWEDFAPDASYTDSIQILVSPTAGTTTSAFTTTLYQGPGSTSDFLKRGTSLGAFNGQTIRVAFRNNSTDKYVLYVDNAATEILAALDGRIDSLDIPKLAGNNTPIKVLVSNQGAAAITSLTLEYSIDGGTPVSQTFNGLNIQSYGSAWVTFTNTLTGLAQGPHNVTVTLTQANSAADPVVANNTGSRAITVPGAAVTRNGLIEEFTSSTCPPCEAFNLWFDPLLQSNNANVPSSHFNVIKYQMNWPSPGNDASYNADGNTRRNYYGVNAIPDHFVNGRQGTANTSSAAQAEITSSKTAPAYVDISGRYSVKGDSLIVEVTVTPNFTLTNANFQLHMAATEKFYKNHNATTNQEDYYHVMRRMFPNGNGVTINNFTSGVAQTFTHRVKYTKGNVTQNSYNFWWHPIDGNLVVFLQDNETRDILQSVSIPASWPLSVNEATNNVGNVKVYPNPATDQTNILFTLDKATKVNVSVTDALGRVDYTSNENTLSSGAQRVAVPTANLAEGIYNVRIQSEEGFVTEKLSVAK